MKTMPNRYWPLPGGRGAWREVVNTDANVYGGSGIGNGNGNGSLHADAQWAHGHEQSLLLHLPPLSCLVLEPA